MRHPHRPQTLLRNSKLQGCRKLERAQDALRALFGTLKLTRPFPRMTAGQAPLNLWVPLI